MRYRTPTEIVACARRYADSQFREREYNLLLRNCQHFASLCATGYEHSVDVEAAGDMVVRGTAAALTAYFVYHGASAVYRWWTTPSTPAVEQGNERASSSDPEDPSVEQVEHPRGP